MTIYVEVRTPGNGKSYEFQLESVMAIGQVKAKVIEDITEIESGNITLKAEKATLYDANTKSRLSGSLTLAAAGVKSGHTLLLL